MASPAYQTAYELNEETILLWGRQLVNYSTVAAAFTKEEFGTFSWSPNRGIWTNKYRAGVPIDNFGTQTTTQFCDITVRVPADPTGLAGFFAIDLLGDHDNAGTNETKSGGADPYSHSVVPGMTGTRCVPYSLAFLSVMDKGAAPAFQFLNCTPKSIHLTGGSGSPLEAELVFTGFWPTAVAAPTGTWKSHPASYLMGYQSYHTINNSAGSAYTAQITDTDVMIQRGLTPVPSYNNAGSQNPVDLIPLALSLSANLSLYYDGLTSGASASTKHMSEYLNYLKSGTTGAPNVFSWKDGNSPQHTWEIDAWPCAWATDNIQTGDGLMTCTASLNAEQDFASATGVTPTMTQIVKLVLKNNISTVITA